MRIAFPTDDSVTISRHFGHAPHYTVVDIENGMETGRESRDKAFHSHGPSHEHNHSAEHDHGHDHGHDHKTMFTSVADCQVLIAGGMGKPALSAAEATGLAVILTTEQTIERALQAYLAGVLVHQSQLAHAPGRRQP